MGHRPKRVAVIGAGVSGLTSAKHLKAVGLEVVVYERYRSPGGNWVYDERAPLEPSYPSEIPSSADFVPESSSKAALSRGPGEKLPLNGAAKIETEELLFAPPSPAYSSLTNNVSTKLQQLKGFPFKEGTPDFVNVRQKQEYLESYSRHFNIEPLIQYNTRVEKLEKVGEKWKITTLTLSVEDPKHGTKFSNTELFDNVVIASGHYHTPRIPSIPGLKEWKETWPTAIQHSKSYRRPETFAGQTVLLIGAGTSSTDIARESVPLAKKVYQSSRGGVFDTPLAFLPAGLERIVGVKNFSSPSSTSPHSVTLVDGTILHDIDRVVLCTGYHFSLPFLQNLHADDTRPEDADEEVLVTDGTMLHNLHLDIFYLPDPSLAFVGIPFFTATFTLFEFQAIAVAHVFSSKAFLPEKEVMREEYTKRLGRKGLGKVFHSLRDEESVYVDGIVEWLNRHAEETGGQRVQGHSEEWRAERALLFEKLRVFLLSKSKNEAEERGREKERERERVVSDEVVSVPGRVVERAVVDPV